MSNLDDALLAYNTKVTTVANEGSAFTSRISAVDVSVWGATKQITAIADERRAFNSASSAGLSVLFNNAVTIMRALPADEQPAATAKLRSALDDATISWVDERRIYNNAVDAKFAENLAYTPTSTVKTPSATNPSASDAAIAEKQAQPNVAQPSSTNSDPNTKKPLGLPLGAQPTKPQVAQAIFNGATDFRPRLEVPSFYTTSDRTMGPNKVINNSNGIVFPYTPTISQDYKANYASNAPIHSNYALYFYKNSAPGEISLSAKFTVQNDNDAHYYLSMVHLLRSLVKMQFGIDANAGAPPPVCRLYAYGATMLDNVPVSLQSFSLKLDDSVDYYSIFSNTLKSIFGANTVPTMSTISLSMIPMYSRAEMKSTGVNDWLNGTARGYGFL